MANLKDSDRIQLYDSDNVILDDSGIPAFPVGLAEKSTDYRLDFYNNIGELAAVVTDFNNLSYTKQTNYPGLLQFEVRGDHPLLESIQDKWEVQVYRRPAGYDWQLDFIGIYRDAEWNYDEKPVFVGTCVGLMEKLAWRYILYYSSESGFTKFMELNAEKIMKLIVDYNCGANATVANGRLREGAIADLTIETDLDRGNQLDIYCTWKNVLETLQGIAEIGGGDFDLVKTAGGDYDFRFYPGQLGTDRRGEVLFSLQRGNMGKPKYKQLRSDEKTVALVGGQGDGIARDTALVEGVNFSSANDIEVFIDARDIEELQTTALENRGAQKLSELQARDVFVFDVLQIPSSRYGVEYFLGDLVNAINPFNQEHNDMKIVAITIGFEKDGKEKIIVGSRQYAPTTPT